MAQKTRIWTDVDFDKEGVSNGYLQVPHSTNDSGYGWIPVPITIIKNGSGPSVLLMAGNHGDEYEGQVLMMKLLRSLSPNRIRGRLVIVPGVNAPAVAAGHRVSPADGGNLNRLFPGDPNGTPTQMIAHYIDSVLLPLVRYCFDFHSGGYSLEYIPSAHVVTPPDPALRSEAIGFLGAFAMPSSILIEGLTGDDQLLLGSCRRLGVGHMSTELGGAGGFSVEAFRAAERGLPRLLRHVGVLVEGDDPGPAPATRFYLRQPARDLVYAMENGVFEANAKLGETVEEGELAGAIHFPEIPWRSPQAIIFPKGGTILAKRAPAKAKIGDCLFALGSPYDA
ncbi:succinylglutamate desuccinylase/aspartoacylase family protein [Mesorhizobium sp. VK23B]|uniref:Succinylglutamate desuccinylase/aspartoacylase family protein n=1 Tax=Mesorhizobium dulcispinae TaxID=3072316 RepID=A0ABU4XP85_9HYPH|nr:MULTISPECIES: succinylglutamate desuccinylase/aspartoacylase family protein [unclassified Mesorhizobium]MDX8470164.1 succinylglutamate desuccinylase/aspartoacylase family protein [Mesorhizobium sp. VK23B]MDX8476560.1 succinylglutamate desuccinylase/aspartoacylase family protein [Mesorhizobium sp. VK23A]